MKRTTLKKTSARQKNINEAKALLREMLILERGNRCEITGRPGDRLGLFHILPTGLYPRIQLNAENILLVNWFPTHYDWHHDPHKKEGIEARIKELRGEDYYDKLKLANFMAPKLTMIEIGNYYFAFRQRLEELKGSKP